MRPVKETYANETGGATKSDAEKRHIHMKETYTYEKRPVKETYTNETGGATKSDAEKRHIHMKETYTYEKRPVKETHTNETGGVAKSDARYCQKNLKSQPAVSFVRALTIGLNLENFC